MAISTATRLSPQPMSFPDWPLSPGATRKIFTVCGLDGESVAVGSNAGESVAVGGGAVAVGVGEE
ncbi:MAG TPA: hypothetical protein G4N92_08305 [Anaerolineae bacterium]|nr:hypothetical protein [Anaerolineae bacterium]